jgi:hypothetical protein
MCLRHQHKQTDEGGNDEKLQTVCVEKFEHYFIDESLLSVEY